MKIKVVYLCRHVPFWRLAQLNSIVGGNPCIVMTVLSCRGGVGHKHADSNILSTPNLTIDSLKSVTFEISSSGRKSNWYFSPGLGIRLIRENPDLLLLEGGSNFPNNIMGLIYAFGTHRPFVVWTLGDLANRNYSLFGSAFRLLVSAIEKRASALIGYSSRSLRYFQRNGISPEKCFKATNVVDVDSIINSHLDIVEFRANCRRKINRNPDEPTFLFVGSLYGGKRLDLLPLIMWHILRKYERSLLTIVGDGPELENLVKLSREKGVFDRMLFMGKVTTGTGPIFASSDVLIMPGLGGLAISESLAWGTPVVCSTADGTEEDLVSNSGSGRVVPFSADNQEASILFAEAVIAEYEEMRNNSLRPLNVQSSVKDTNTLKNYGQSVRSAINLAAQDK